jgi:hypothetical protein
MMRFGANDVKKFWISPREFGSFVLLRVHKRPAPERLQNFLT